MDQELHLPMLSTFLHTRFSAIRVNDPSKKTGYFFGSFFILKKEAFTKKLEPMRGLKHEIIEDGALGKKVKESGFCKLKMVQRGTPELKQFGLGVGQPFGTD